MAGCDLLELSRHLKQERLYVNSERELLHRLHEEVLHAADQLYHVSWITRQQKHNLQQLILANKNVTPKMCSLRANSLEHIKFVDGYKYLSYHESKIGEFLKQLCSSPHVLAICLMQTERASFDNMQKLAQVIVGSLYGNMVMQEDESHLLQVLKALIELQIATSDNPRRLLRKGSCAFSVVFKLLNEGLFSGKLFLTAALRQPVMQLLMEDEWFYDIDPSRALHRFPTQERIRRFGSPDSKEYEEKTKQYRELTTNKLVMLTEHFIENIRNNVQCFPPSLAWLISQLYHNIVKKGQTSETEARVMCADLTFTLFICPAICDPEPYGITSDAPISYIARHNLMQVAQILQVLAISSSCDQIEPKTRDLYRKFPEGCVSFLLDELLEGPCIDEPHRLQSTLPDFHKTAVLLTITDLTDMLNIIRQTANCLDEDDSTRKQVEAWLESLPSAATLHSLRSRHATPNTTPHCTPPGTPASTKKILKGRDRRRLLPNHLEPPGVSGSDSDDGTTPQCTKEEDVLVISLGVPTECPGMLPEHKVFEQASRPPCRSKCNSLVPGEDNPICESEIHLNEKRTRFSLSHDQDSIATSDNLEAISEAASSHSAASDIENDNLSDMVSANVSGRGTPSISGRDTPISQEESQTDGAEEERRVPNLPVTVQKTNREDVTDRFGKFDIKQELERYETKSTVSDTWSTDVLASDSEPPEQNQLERLEEVAEEMARQNLLSVGVAEVFEPSETASDAWSTDVLASDTSERQADRLLELDQDELASLSSRGQCPDEIDLEEQREDREDTPQASAQVSGSGSPKDSVGHLDEVMGSRSPETTPCSSMDKYDESPSRRTLDNGTDEDDFGGDREHSTPVNSLSKVTFDIAATDHNSAESSMALMPSGDISSTSCDFDLGKPLDTSVESLTRDVTEGLKLTEQQNVKIDENRLSATIGLFDPLIQESVITDCAARRSLPSECLVPLLPAPTNTLPRSYSGQGARPKVAFRPIQDVQINEPQSDGHMSLLQKPEVAANSLFDVTDSGNRSSSGSSDKMSTGSATDGSNSRSHSFDNCGPLVDIPGITTHLEATITPSHASAAEVKEFGDYDDQSSDGKKKPTTGFFRSFKERLSKGGRRKLSKQFDRDEMGKLVTQSMEIDKGAGGDGNYDVLRPMSAPSALEESLGRESEVLPGSSPAQETSDDILAKYRNPKPAETVDQPSNQRQSRLPSAVDDDDDSIAYDPLNLETCKAFVDAKKKLRLVLSTLDPQMVPMMHGVMPQRTHHHHDNELIAFLQILLAEALNLQDHDAIAQLHETIRCLRQFETHETKKLLKTMKEEYRNRSPYISYLVRCRQALLATHACLERMLCRAQKDKVACNKYFLSVFVRLFLEKMERSLMKFIADFQKFTVADEKTDLLEKYLVYLHKQMEQDSTWQGASEKQVEEARVYVERHVMSHIYTHAMFPNGEGDFMRDQILHKHMGKLAQVITPNHKDLRIAKMYHYECPWPAAQAEIYMINVYKTPADKLQCAVRCASIIMNLLSMANEKSVPAADDFMPVLIYILIKANPPSLLSTVQYVSSFYEKRLFGEEQYWWTQLTSAIEFIKTMDYGS